MANGQSARWHDVDHKVMVVLCDMSHLSMLWIIVYSEIISSRKISKPASQFGTDTKCIISIKCCCLNAAAAAAALFWYSRPTKQYTVYQSVFTNI